MESAPWLRDLNPAQLAAVTHGDGPLLVVAGAGTGKTKTLVCRVACLIDRGVPPDRILLLTFTRRAAAEMLARAGRLVSGQDGGAAGKVWGGTFHAVANRLLRIYGRAIGIHSDFTVMDQGDAADMMGLIRNELGLAKRDRRFAQKRTLAGIYSRMVNAQEKLSTAVGLHFPWCKADIHGIREVFGAYTERKREHHVLDYDDLLLMWNVLATAPGVGDTLADRFDHILVDEYQDTNPIQSELLQALRRRRASITAVGDDAQSIYSFRAATIRNILDFPTQFSETRVVTLEQNYRSNQPILCASNRVMEQASERYTKELWSERKSEQKPILVTCLDEPNQCEAVCVQVLAHLEEGIPLMRQAVLFRTGHHSDQLEVELSRRNIPFRKFGGLKFIETAHVKDMLAFLRILENPFDEMSWFRVLQLMQGVGPRIARRIMDGLGMGRNGADSAGDAGDAEAASPLRRLVDDPPAAPPAAREQFAAMRVAFAECLGVAVDASDSGNAEPPSLPAQVERMREFYEPIFSNIYENPAIRLRDIEQLEQIAAGYSSRARFVADLTLDPPASASDLAQPPYLDEDYLTLSTIHSAKGCEWDVVHIIHAADGMIPSDMAVRDEAGVDEERRLFYVAMTRAKDWLYVYCPLRYYHQRFGMSDAHGYAQLSRYITSDVRAAFEQRCAYADAMNDTPARIAGTSHPDARIRSLIDG